MFIKEQAPAKVRLNIHRGEYKKSLKNCAKTLCKSRIKHAWEFVKICVKLSNEMQSKHCFSLGIVLVHIQLNHFDN
jgi:hypothetical protein